MDYLKEIGSIIEEAFSNSMSFFCEKDSTSKVLLSSNCRIPNVSETKFMEVLFKEDMLKDKEVDLLTIEINYSIKDRMTDVCGECFCNDGIIMNKFHHHAYEEDIDDIEKSLTSFLEEIKNKYDDMLKNYIQHKK